MYYSCRALFFLYFSFLVIVGMKWNGMEWNIPRVMMDSFFYILLFLSVGLKTAGWMDGWM